MLAFFSTFFHFIFKGDGLPRPQLHHHGGRSADLGLEAGGSGQAGGGQMSRGHGLGSRGHETRSLQPRYGHYIAQKTVVQTVLSVLSVQCKE